MGTNKLLEQAKKVIEDKGALKPCPRCGHSSFTLADKLTFIPAQESPNVFGGDTVPAVMVVCTNCGYIFFHALLAMGLQLEDEPARKD